MAEAAGIHVEELGLFTDLYQLTMAQSYLEHDKNRPATFSLIVRKFPPEHSYLVAAGLTTVLEYLEQVRFSSRALTYLRQTGRFSEAFLTSLATWRFQGDVVALPEGSVFFCNEPVLEVTAPIVDAQLVESFLVNAVHLQTLIATKAARCVEAARGRSLIDFALRRTHGTDAALKVARASYLAGFDATSNVLAGQVYGIPISGTMAHAYVESFTDELEAFRAFAVSYPEHTVLLIDTYDTVLGAVRAALVGQEMAHRGQHLRGVRLDSGDMTALSKEVRVILDQAGLQDVRIVASGSFDEDSIDAAVRGGACIDAFGVGTKMGVAADMPYLDMAYKLVQYDGRPVMKLSTGKATLVDQKQVWRRTVDGYYGEDIIALRREPALPDAVPLLQGVMRAGQVLPPVPDLAAARQRYATDRAHLAESYRRLKGGAVYPVRVSEALATVQHEVETALRQQCQDIPVMLAYEGDLPMDPHTLETYRQGLLALQQQLVQRIFDMEASMLAMDADRDIERTDRVQEEAAEVTLTALDEQGRREMAAIQAALARIDAGTYGICDTCGETISAARLTAMPMARRCVSCQERLEHRSTHV